MNKTIKLLLLCAPVMFVAACGGDDDIDDRLDIADPKVRLVHAVPAGPNVALYRDGVQQPDASNVPYKGASKYFDVSGSNATWTVSSNPGNVAIGSQVLNASRGNKYTFVAVPDAGTGTELLLIADPYNKGLGTSKARVRVLNAAFNAPDVDVYINEPNTDLTTVGPVFPSVDYKAAEPASGSDSNEFAAGNHVYWLTITAAGTKVPVFRAPVTVPDNGDWVVTLVPDTVAPLDVKVLVVKANDDASTSDEVANTL
jgi:hypothetical protein